RRRHSRSTFFPYTTLFRSQNYKAEPVQTAATCVTPFASSSGGRVNPRLLVIAGPLRDSTILLYSAEVPVGRDPGNVVAISDPSLSRRHCALVRDEARYWIGDLQSRNGTFGHGVAVT